MINFVDRRRFLGGLGGLAVAGSVPIRLARPAIASAEPRLVIIGGGPGGAAVAIAVKRADPTIEVTLVEPKNIYATCFFSNHYVAGLRSFGSLTHGYDGLRARGIKVIHDRAIAIDTARRAVKIGRGKELAYDRLVVAPGIDLKYETIEGYSEKAAETMPHAWQGGEQTRLLKKRLDALADGDTVVLAVPRNPYRCPPGPYERACVIAHHLKTKKPKSKLVILDPKMSFSKQPVFEEAFARYYKDIIELRLTNDIDDFTVTRVDPRTGEISTKAGETFKAGLANIIPDQKAGWIAHQAGLTEGDWCPIRPESFASAKAENVYVIGDAAIADGMPKSAFSAHNQANAVAGHVLADLRQKERPAAHYRNTCWSWLAPEDSAKIGADFEPGEVAGKLGLKPLAPFVSKTGEAAEVRKANFDDSVGWYESLTFEVYPEHSKPKKGVAGSHG